MMALFVILGAPLVAILWETLNELLALQPTESLLLSIPALVLLVVLLWFLRRTLERRDAATS